MENKKSGLSYIFFAYFCLFTLGFIDNTRGPLYPFILEHFQLNQTSGSFMFGITSVASFFTSLMAFWWFPKFGAMVSSRLAMLLVFFSLFMMGACASWQGPFSLFVMANFLFGMSVGLSGISLNMLIVHNTSLLEKRKYLAGLHSMYGIASFMAPGILKAFMTNNVSWGHYLLLLLIPLTMLLAVGFKLPRTGIKEYDHVQVRAPLRLSILLAFILSFYVASELLISSRLVTFLVDGQMMAKIEAMDYLTLFFIFLLCGRASLFFWRINIASTTLLLLSLCFSFLFSAFGIFVHPIGLSLAGGSMSIFYPTYLDWINARFPDVAQSLVARGVTAIGLMLVLMHFGFGAIADGIGIQYAMALSPLFLVLVIIVFVFSLKKLKA